MMHETEVLVVGAGPAGLAAATAAAKHGRKVLVLDDNSTAGGQIWRGGIEEREGNTPSKSKAIHEFQASGAELLCGRRVVDAPSPNILQTVTDFPYGCMVESFSWQQLILATGARERFLPFPGWTLPGVMGAGGLQAFAKSGLPVKGKRIVVAGTGPLLLAVAAHLLEHGATVLCVAEQASFAQLLPFAASLWSHPRKLLQGVQYRMALRGISYRAGCWPISAEGESSLKQVRLTNGKRTWTEECDFLACGFHLVPNTELAELFGCRMREDFVAVDAQMRTSVRNVFCAGETTGIAGLEAALIQGRIAGLTAAGKASEADALQRARRREQTFAQRLAKAFRLRQELRVLATDDTIVCRCEDVSFAALKGHTSWTEAKLQTRCGMGPCQGRICGPAVHALFDWHPASVRPPIFPVPVAAFNGSNHSLSKISIVQEMP
jgi:NADPH-dependent 2,4-dienoyl-CoA reductase/sulfur reductase-like enzyme